MPSRDATHIYIYTILPLVGGNSTISLGLASFFREQDWNVTIMVKNQAPHGVNGEIIEQLRREGCDVRLLRRGTLSEFWELFGEVWKCHHRSETVFISIGMGFMAPALAMLGGFSKSFFYYINHDPELNAVRRLGWTLRLFSGLIVISPASLSLIKKLAYAPRRSVWLPQFSEISVSENIFSPAKQPARLRFGYVGSFVRSKGVGNLAKFWRDWMPHDVFLDILGDGEERSIVENVAARSGNVHYRGKFSASERSQVLPEFFSGLDYLVVPSIGHGEGIPTVILEAFSFGVPVISTNGGGTIAFGGALLNADFAGCITLVETGNLYPTLLTAVRSPEGTASRIRGAYEKWFSDRVVSQRWRESIFADDENEIVF